MPDNTFNLHRDSTSTYAWEDRDGAFLGIRIPISSGGHARTLVSGIERHFIRVHADGITDIWKVDNVREHANKLYLYGAQVDARSLTELAKNQTLPDICNILRCLLQAMEGYPHELPRFSPDYILIGTNNDVYLPSPSLNRALQSLSYVANATIQGTSHCKENTMSAMLLECAHVLCTGEKPVEDALRPPLLDFPQLSPCLSDALDRGKILPPPQVFLESFYSGYADTTTTETKDIALREKQYRKRLRNSYQNKRRRRIIYLASLGTMALLFFILNTGQREELPIIEPTETVQQFYTSINTLNHALMLRLTKGRAGSYITDEVSRLFVSSRMQLAMEGKTSIIPPQQYSEGSNKLVYGISNLQQKIIAEDDEQITISVFYEKWQPDIQSETAIGLQRNNVQDRVVLRRYKDQRWYIIAIEELSNKNIDD